MTVFIGYVHTLLFWGFVVIKLWGVTFATWSWWWLFLPIVPYSGVAVERFGL